MAQNINPFYSSQNTPNKATEEKQNIPKDNHAVSKRYDASCIYYLKEKLFAKPVPKSFLLSTAMNLFFTVSLTYCTTTNISSNRYTKSHNLFAMFGRNI